MRRMNSRSRVIAIVGVAGFALVVLTYWLSRSGRDERPSSPLPPKPIASARAGIPGKHGTGTGSSNDAAVSIQPDAAEQKLIKISPDQILAIVNGVSITLKDLTALSKSDPDRD